MVVWESQVLGCYRRYDNIGKCRCTLWNINCKTISYRVRNFIYNLYASGSTRFGDTLDDIHQFTGSVKITGSLEVGGHAVTEVSNDMSLTDESPNALVTEFALANYTGSEFTKNVALLLILEKLLQNGILNNHTINCKFYSCYEKVLLHQ